MAKAEEGQPWKLARVRGGRSSDGRSLLGFGKRRGERRRI